MMLIYSKGVLCFEMGPRKDVRSLPRTCAVQARVC